MDTQIHVMSLPTPKYEKWSWSTLIDKIFKLALESNHSLSNQQLWEQHYLYNRKNNSLSLYAKISEIKMDLLVPNGNGMNVLQHESTQKLHPRQNKHS